MWFLFFFFQAEDGIRDYKVTGVQTCALPISVACPKLVPLIESADPFGAATVDAVREYAQPLKDAGCDTVILGCTQDRKSTRLNSSHLVISYAVFCLKKKRKRMYGHDNQHEHF